MKIGHLENKPPVSPVASDRKGSVGEAASGAAKAAGGDAAAEPSAKVELSSAAALLGGGATPEFDAEKVARIAQAIRDGKFQVNAEAIADKLIANAQELLGRTGGR